MKVANIVVARRLEIDIVNLVANRTISPSRHPLLEQIQRHVDQDRDDVVALLGGELFETAACAGVRGKPSRM